MKANVQKSSLYWRLNINVKLTSVTHLTVWLCRVPTMSSAAAFHETAIEVTQEIGRRITVVTEDTRETEFLFQRLSMSLQRGNAVSFQNTMITDWNVVAAIYIV